MTETDLHPELRPLLFSIAYRMIGSVSEAEDIVQEAFLRYHRAQPTDVESPKAYLSAVTTRLAIDHLRSARARREEYVGPWLPEPLLIDEGAGDPSAHAELADSLSFAFLVLLERLSPVERAAFLLREVFAYPDDEIAEVIGKSEANTRQLVSRARRHADAERPRFEVDREAHEELTDRFIEATQNGDTEGLIELLAEDVYTYTDGGGKAQARGARSTAASTSRGSWSASPAPTAAPPPSRCTRRSSTACRAASRATPRATPSPSSRSTWPTGWSRLCASSSTPTSSRTCRSRDSCRGRACPRAAA
jgi:RNA polymerase sigma factor (sigma-70 family)